VSSLPLPLFPICVYYVPGNRRNYYRRAMIHARVDGRSSYELCCVEEILESMPAACSTTLISSKSRNSAIFSKRWLEGRTLALGALASDPAIARDGESSKQARRVDRFESIFTLDDPSVDLSFRCRCDRAPRQRANY